MQSSEEDPIKILNTAYQNALSHLDSSFIKDELIRDKVKLVSTNLNNRACVRFLMSCLLAKLHKPWVDIRKPYTEIKGDDTYSGRRYDEEYVNILVHDKCLPCNTTTGFLTPALRNIDFVLTPDVDLQGFPKNVYKATLELIDYVYKEKISADILLSEIVRDLLIYKRNKEQRISQMLEELRSTEDSFPLSSENIVALIEQHLKAPKSSRLPVLVVAAAYKAASENLNENILPLAGHNAADKQTKNLGDIEITVIDNSEVITSYEMKTRKVTKEDVDDALQKIKNTRKRVDNYIFITTDVIQEDVQDYCRKLYKDTGGIEFVILDCIGFLRHFLHLFHRLRIKYLDAYQELLLQEPESAVNQPLKENFLSLRQLAEIDKSNGFT